MADPLTDEERRDIAIELGRAYSWRFWCEGEPHQADEVDICGRSVAFAGQPPRVGDTLFVGPTLVTVTSAHWSGRWVVTVEVRK